MTNKEDVDTESSIEPRLAAFLALHLVSQVIDEAYIIANAAKDSGQPWRYLTILKNLRSGRLGDPDDEYSFVAPPTTCNSNLATSTPQKLPDDVLKALDESLISQGDEDFESTQSNLSKAQSTSMFINHLFNLSEVEETFGDDEDVINIEKTYDVKNVSMQKIVASCVDAAFDLATEVESFGGQIIEKENNSTNNAEDVVANCVDLDISTDKTNKKELVASIVDASGDADFIEGHERKLNMSDKEDFLIFERAFLTLNRDEDQCSDNAEAPLMDPKNLSMQDIELIKNTDQEGDSVCADTEMELKVPTSARYKKSSLAHRCRVQGTRLLARLRGWWRRKTPGRRMEYGVQRSARDACQSPDPRRRAASLRAQRHLSSHSTSSSALWKYNTVNEVLVNASHWKEYKYELKPNCDDGAM